VHVITRIRRSPTTHRAPSTPPADAWPLLVDVAGAGLAVEEALRRFARLGPNKLDEGKPPHLEPLLAQVSDFTVLALIAAAVIPRARVVAPEPARFLGKFGDSIAIS